MRNDITTASHTPYFLLREIDVEILRGTGGLAQGERSEQATRTIINNLMSGQHLWTTQAELQAFKTLGLLTPKAPRAAVISAAAVVSLLRFFALDINALVLESCILHFTL